MTEACKVFVSLSKGVDDSSQTHKRRPVEASKVASDSPISSHPRQATFSPGAFKPTPPNRLACHKAYFSPVTVDVARSIAFLARLPCSPSSCSVAPFTLQPSLAPSVFSVLSFHPFSRSFRPRSSSASVAESLKQLAHHDSVSLPCLLPPAYRVTVRGKLSSVAAAVSLSDFLFRSRCLSLCKPLTRSVCLTFCLAVCAVSARPIEEGGAR